MQLKSKQQQRQKTPKLLLHTKFLCEDDFIRFCNQINRPDLVNIKSGKTIPYHEIRTHLLQEKTALELALCE